MQKLLLPFLIIFSSLLYSQNVKVTDYQVPVSSAKTLRFDGQWNWSQTGDAVTANNANAAVLYRTFYSSLPLAWFIDVDAVGSKSFGEYSHNINFNGSFRKYIWDNRDLFGFTTLNAQHAKVYDQIASDLTVGFGYGRYINATALAKAVRIEDHLLKDGVLTTNLPKETMINIANIIEREAEYRDIHGEVYEQYLFDDIETEIQETGQLTENTVGSIGVLRMRQVLFNINERVNDRYYGWDVTAGILFPLTSAYDSIPTGNPNLTIGGRYAFPLSWRTQINTVANVFTPLDSTAFKQVRARVGLDFIYELSNRINFVAGYRLGLFKPAGEDVEREHNLNTSFWYYLENNIYLTISADYIKIGNNPRIISTRVGLQYNLF
ncbi:MAG: hypothetical protein R6W90_13240 [Ignavibacteriaceae bacterium]